MDAMAGAKPPNKLLHLMVALTLALAAFWFLWTLLLWYKLHPHMPWRDTFVILDTILEQPTLFNWQFWIEPHYAAHRIAIPRLLVVADTYLLAGQNHLLYAFAWASVLTCIGMLSYLARDYFEFRRSNLLFYLGIIAILMFAPAHLWNLVNAINSSWHITFAFAFASFFILLRGAHPPGKISWLAAYAFASAAAFTTFAGVIVWLLLPLLAIRGSRAALVSSAAISITFAALYCAGLSSDAEIAAQWQGESSEIIDQIRATGAQALADNTWLAVIHKTLALLAWPLSLEKTLTGTILVGASVCFLAIVSVRLLKVKLGQTQGNHPFLKLCLMASILALGIAVAIQLGRLIEQPNHPDGPSFERYNTIVAIYWIGIMGLALGALNRLDNLHRLLLMGSCLIICVVLTYPKGDYLRQEIKSMENAGRLYASGENPKLRRRAAAKMQRIKPEYVFRFEPLFKERKLAYMAPGEPPDSVRDATSECPENSVVGSYRKSPIKGHKTLEVRLGSLQWAITRDLLVYSQGKFLARLYPRHTADYTPLRLAEPAHNVFIGQIRSKEARMGLLTLVANSLGPNLFHCRMPNTIIER